MVENAIEDCLLVVWDRNSEKWTIKIEVSGVGSDLTLKADAGYKTHLLICQVKQVSGFKSYCKLKFTERLDEILLNLMRAKQVPITDTF
jgi:hypothetical protein